MAIDLAPVSELRNIPRSITGEQFVQLIRDGRGVASDTIIVDDVVIDRLQLNTLNMNCTFRGSVEIRDVTARTAQFDSGIFCKDLTIDGLVSDTITSPHIVDGRLIIKNIRVGNGLTVNVLPPINP